MEQALINLLVNAGQSSPIAEPIDLIVASDPNMLRIKVRDRGMGIPEEDLDRIFQPFYTNRAQGTGLGLALVKRIATAHGGDVFAQNHPEGGAVFTMEIPMRNLLNEGGSEDA
jgi:signal transduction histidine kinase